MILVVDDDNVTARVWSYLFGRLRRQTVVATSGADALRVLATQPVEAIVCAVVLPDMDGLSLIAHVRSRRHIADVPIVVCTGQTDAETVQRALALGVMDFLVKPIHADHLPRVQRVIHSIPPRWESRRDTVRRLQVSTPEATRLVALARRDLGGVMALIDRHLAAAECGAPALDDAMLTTEIAAAIRRLRDAAATVGARRCAEVLGRYLYLPVDVSVAGLRDLREALAIEDADFVAALPPTMMPSDMMPSDRQPAGPTPRAAA